MNAHSGLVQGWGGGEVLHMYKGLYQVWLTGYSLTIALAYKGGFRPEKFTL